MENAMLKKFTVSDFKRISNLITIDFSKVSNYEFEPECIKNNIIKTSILLGNNGIGKTSLVNALFDIVYNVTDNYVNPVNYANYLNLSRDCKFASFSYEFLIDGKNIEYSYKKRNLSSFLAEKLVIDGKTVIEYDRTLDNSNLAINFKGTESLSRDLSKIKISVLKYVKSNTAESDSDEYILFKKFIAFVEKMLLFWSLENRSFTGFSEKPNQNIVEEIVRRGHFKDLQIFFREAGITDELAHASPLGTEQLFFKFGNKLLPFDSACSTGSSSLLLLFYWLEDIGNKDKSPSFVCIDEFDAFYHFKLARMVVEKLKKADCQVLLTTQNTSLLGNDILRPDCYFLMDQRGINNFSSLTTKELRQVHNIEKLYRGGTFSK